MIGNCCVLVSSKYLHARSRFGLKFGATVGHVGPRARVPMSVKSRNRCQSGTDDWRDNKQRWRRRVPVEPVRAWSARATCSAAQDRSRTMFVNKRPVKVSLGEGLGRQRTRCCITKCTEKVYAKGSVSTGSGEYCDVTVGTYRQNSRYLVQVDRYFQ